MKFVVDYGDGSDQEIIQDLANLSQLTQKTLIHTFLPGTLHITNYTVGLSGIKTDLSTDVYTLAVKIGKSNVTDYRDIKIINSYLYTTPAGINNLMLTVEAQNPRYIGNLIIPYAKDTLAGKKVKEVELLSTLITDIHLRTEIYSAIGPWQSIVTESTFAYMFREDQVAVCVIGDQFGEQIIIHLDDTITVTDINGNTSSAEAILIPEFSEECPELDGLEYQ